METEVWSGNISYWLCCFSFSFPQGRQPFLLHLLSLYKVFSPELVTLSIPSRMRVCTCIVKLLLFSHRMILTSKTSIFFCLVLSYRVGLRTTFPPGSRRWLRSKRGRVRRLHPASAWPSRSKIRPALGKGYVVRCCFNCAHKGITLHFRYCRGFPVSFTIFHQLLSIRPEALQVFCRAKRSVLLSYYLKYFSMHACMQAITRWDS